MQYKAKQKAFTFIELIISLMLMSTLMVGLASMYKTYLHFEKTIKKSYQELTNVNTTIQHIINFVDTNSSLLTSTSIDSTVITTKDSSSKLLFDATDKHFKMTNSKDTVADKHWVSIDNMNLSVTRNKADIPLLRIEVTSGAYTLVTIHPIRITT